MNRSAVSVFALAASLAGCGGVQHYQNPSPTHVATVHVWVERDKYLPVEYVLQGCEIWKDKGIRCIQVSERKHSEVQIVTVLHPCSSDKDGSTTLAFAAPGGQISVITDCFVDNKNMFKAKAFRAVIGHEIGHEFGIWKHVPMNCEKGVKICGRALMNPSYKEDVDFITPIDSLAFDARELDHAVISHDGEEPTLNKPQTPNEDGCVYKIWPASPPALPRMPIPF